MKRIVLLLIAVFLTVPLASGVALAALIDGTPGDDERLDGTEMADTINGYAGDDKLWGYEKNDTLDAGPGRDFLNGMDGGDLLRGGDGADRIYGLRGADTISGGGGGDLIWADRPSPDRVDVVRCGPGHDSVRADEEDRVADDCETVLIG